jgi:hypothetical protein
MKYLSVVVLLSAAAALGQQAPSQIVPSTVLNAKTVIARVWWPDATRADQNGIQAEAEHFLNKWKRYRVVRDIAQADLAVLVVIEPMTVQPSFWSKLAWGIAASTAGSCYGETFSDGQVLANCYQFVPPPPLPTTILAGSILVYDAAQLRAHQIDGMDVQPIMISFAEKRGRAPLVGAGKKLRKEIDQASKFNPAMNQR